jgi:hypothetical protein
MNAIRTVCGLCSSSVVVLYLPYVSLTCDFFLWQKRNLPAVDDDARGEIGAVSVSNLRPNAVYTRHSLLAFHARDADDALRPRLALESAGRDARPLRLVA